MKGTTRREPGSRTSEIQHSDSTAKTVASQRNIVLAYLQTNHSLTTLEARNELFIMGIAARIFELKARGYNIVTHMVPVNFGCKRRIAKYSLLPGAPHVEN